MNLRQGRVEGCKPSDDSSTTPWSIFKQEIVMMVVLKGEKSPSHYPVGSWSGAKFGAELRLCRKQCPCVFSAIEMIHPEGHLLIFWKADHSPTACPTYAHLPCRSPRAQTSIASRSNFFSSFLISELFHEKKGHRIAILELRNQHVNRAENFPFLGLTFYMKHFVE